MEHLRSRRLRSSVDLSKKKATAHEHGMHPFGILSNSDMFLLSCMGDPYSKKKRRDRSHLGLIAVAIFTSATDAFTLRKHCSFISEYICVNGSKKKRKEKNSWRVGHSSKAFNGNPTCIIFFVNANGEISPGEMKLKRRSFY